MKRIIINILIFCIIWLIVLLISSIPPKIDQEKFNTIVKNEVNKMRETSEEYSPNISEEKREEMLKIYEISVVTSLENEKSFSYRFARNLHTYCILIPIGIVGSALKWLHRKELHGG